MLVRPALIVDPSFLLCSESASSFLVSVSDGYFECAGARVRVVCIVFRFIPDLEIENAHLPLLNGIVGPREQRESRRMRLRVLQHDVHVCTTEMNCCMIEGRSAAKG